MTACVMLMVRAVSGHENNQVTTNNAISTQQNFQLDENPCFIQSNISGKATEDGYSSELLEIHKRSEINILIMV